MTVPSSASFIFLPFQIRDMDGGGYIGIIRPDCTIVANHFNRPNALFGLNLAIQVSPDVKALIVAAMMLIYRSKYDKTVLPAIPRHRYPGSLLPRPASSQESGSNTDLSSSDCSGREFGDSINPLHGYGRPDFWAQARTRTMTMNLDL